MSLRRFRVVRVHCETIFKLAMAASLPACERAPAAADELAKAAESARAAQAASAAAALSGEVPLGKQPAVLAEPFSPRKPTSMGSPAQLTTCALDHVAEGPAKTVSTVERTYTVRLIGWAADTSTGTVPPVVVIELAGKQTYYVKAVRLTKRPDVAAALKMPALVNSGYDAMASFRVVEPGEYAFNVLQVS